MCSSQRKVCVCRVTGTTESLREKKYKVLTHSLDAPKNKRGDLWSQIKKSELGLIFHDLINTVNLEMLPISRLNSLTSFAFWRVRTLRNPCVWFIPEPWISRGWKNTVSPFSISRCTRGWSGL